MSEHKAETDQIGFVGPLEEADQDRCPLCGDDPLDPTLHAQTCPTVTENLCGVMQAGQMCMRADHLPDEVRDQKAWGLWRDEHEWVALDLVKRPGQPGATP